MKDIISSIITSVLTALYQPFWFSVILSVMVLFFYLFAYHNETGGRGIRGAFSVWWQYFRGNAFFRKLFFLTFYTTMILFRTLLNRDMWMNPLSDVMANWWIWKYGEDGTRYLTTECIENLMLFIPFTILLFWTAGKKILKKTTFLNIVWTGLKITFVFSLSIELLQLFLRLGTFQVSDLTYKYSWRRYWRGCVLDWSSAFSQAGSRIMSAADSRKTEKRISPDFCSRVIL